MQFNMPVLLQYLLGLIALLGVVAYGYGIWKQGRNQSELDNDSIYKGRIEALETKIKSQGESIEDLTAQVKKLRQDNEDANTKLLAAMNILQGRDPAMAEFIKSGNQFMMKAEPVLIRLDKYLNKQTF